MSMMEREAPPSLATYAYRPEMKTEIGLDPVLGVATVRGELGLLMSMMDIEAPL
jgi:hypothetical protein